MNCDFSWIIPLYNDQDSLDFIVERSLSFLTKTGASFEIILVNDGSKDETPTQALRWTEKNPAISLISHEKNLGYGAALRSGFAAAVGKKWTGYTDGDAQYDPCDFLNSWAMFKTQSHAALLGYKQNRADGLYRQCQSFIFAQIIRRFFSLAIRDLNCSLKVFPSPVLQKYSIQSQSAFIDTELLLLMKKDQVSFLEVPVRHFKRGAQWGGAEHPGHGARVKTVAQTFLEMWKFHAHFAA